MVTYAYDANHNRTSMVTSAGTTTYTYDSADTALSQKTDTSGIVTKYGYDLNGNLTSATYDPTGVHQQTVYKYDTNNRLSEVDKPDGSVVTFAYDADGNRTSKSITASGVTTTVADVYQNGRVAYQTDGGGTLLATFTYDDNGVPTSVQVGSNPQTAPRYYYVYNGHGDVVNLAGASGNIVASYSYDEFGIPQSSSESFPGGWSNPYRYDGRDRVRYDGETALYWMSVRAYDPTLGRFISRDPLGRAPLMGWTSQPYAYAGNNPLVNVDPSGQRLVGASGAVVESAPQRHANNRSTYHAEARRPYQAPSAHVASRKAPRAAAGQPDCDGGSTALECERAARVKADATDEANALGLAPQLTSIFSGLAAYYWKYGVDGFIKWIKDTAWLSAVSKAVGAGIGAHALLLALGGVLYGIEANHDLNWFANRDNVTNFLSNMKDAVKLVGSIIGGLVIGAAFGSGGVLLLDPAWWGATIGSGTGLYDLATIMNNEQAQQLGEYNWTPPLDMVSCSADPAAWDCRAV